MSKFTKWRIRRFIHRIIGFVLNPFLKVNYMLAEHLWSARPNDHTCSYACHAQDMWWHRNRTACVQYVNRRFTASDENVVPEFD